MTAKLPAGLVLRLVGDTLTTKCRHMRERIDRNPRRGDASKAVGRQRLLDRLRGEVRSLRTLRAEGDVSSEVAGLLIAWAADHTEAIAELEALDPRVETLARSDLVGACRLLLKAR